MRANPSIPIAFGLLTLIPAPSLSAEDIRLGGQLGLTVPTGTLHTLVDGKAGFTLGATALIDFREGHALRPRLDYARWEGTQPIGLPSNLASVGSGATASQTTRVSSWNLGADYLRYLRGSVDEGPYLLAGLGIASNFRDADVKLTSSTLSGSGSQSHRNTHFAWNLGLGYQFTANFGMEAGYRWTSLQSQELVFPVTGGGNNYQMNAPQEGGAIGFWSLGAVLRF